VRWADAAPAERDDDASDRVPSGAATPRRVAFELPSPVTAKR
jgi:hypothetical protein